MMETKKKSFWEKLFFLNPKKPETVELKPQTKQVLPPPLPNRQISRTTTVNPGLSAFEGSGKQVVLMEFAREVIPVIRKLSWVNADVSQALDNVVTLANTGFEVEVDEDTDPKMIQAIHNHLLNKMSEWGTFLGGRSGLINRMFRQAMIGGAVCVEWVPNHNLTTLEKIAFVKPEEIWFKYDLKKRKFYPFQKVPSLVNTGKGVDDMIPLNPHTFRYLSLQGDDDSPYGIPHYMSAIQDLILQHKMKDNINFIVTQLGIVGFMQMLLDKPDQKSGESDGAYKTRLETLLTDAKVRIEGGVREGIMVGFKDDVEFEFNTATKSVSGVNEIFQEMELQIASGLKMDASLLGRSYSGSEGQITVVLNKQISQLKNIQNLVAENLEYGFKLELMMAGFKFKNLKIKFNPSTLLDDYKLQQGQEVKLRNINQEYNMGLISQEKAANMAGHKKPDQAKPRVITDPSGKAKDKQEREKGKDASDRKSRKAKKPIDKSQKDKGTRNK